MKKKIKLLLFIIFTMMVLPCGVYAETYNKLDFRKTLAEEEIEEKFKSYKPDENAITIYMFRGKGCGYCRAYLEFMNSITDEYGKYFKMETYEVWNDSANSKLMQDVSSFLGQPAGGVPYIIIGDKVFGGYSSTYDDSIKEAITKLYDTKKSKRYDVFKEMEKGSKSSFFESLDDNFIIWNFVFEFVASVIIITYINLKFKELDAKIDKGNNNKIKNDKKSKK